MARPRHQREKPTRSGHECQLTVTWLEIFPLYCVMQVKVVFLDKGQKDKQHYWYVIEDRYGRLKEKSGIKERIPRNWWLCRGRWSGGLVNRQEKMWNKRLEDGQVLCGLLLGVMPMEQICFYWMFKGFSGGWVSEYGSGYLCCKVNKNAVIICCCCCGDRNI